MKKIFGELSTGSGANFLRHTLRPGLAMIGMAAVFMAAATHGSGSSDYEVATENCVAALRGKSTDLIVDRGGETLQHPAEVLDQHRACEWYDNNAEEAARHVVHIALAQAGQ